MSIISTERAQRRRIQATASHGSIDVSSVTGDMDFTGGNGSDIRMEDIGGNVKLETRGADSIHCNNVKGTVDLHGRGSDVELENISGQVTVGGDYTGSISLRRSAKPFTCESMRTQLDAQDHQAMCGSIAAVWTPKIWSAL